MMSSTMRPAAGRCHPAGLPWRSAAAAETSACPRHARRLHRPSQELPLCSRPSLASTRQGRAGRLTGIEAGFFHHIRLRQGRGRGRGQLYLLHGWAPRSAGRCPHPLNVLQAPVTGILPAPRPGLRSPGGLTVLRPAEQRSQAAPFPSRRARGSPPGCVHTLAERLPPLLAKVRCLPRQKGSLRATRWARQPGAGPAARWQALRVSTQPCSAQNGVCPALAARGATPAGRARLARLRRPPVQAPQVRGQQKGPRCAAEPAPGPAWGPCRPPPADWRRRWRDVGPSDFELPRDAVPGQDRAARRLPGPGRPSAGQLPAVRAAHPAQPQPAPAGACGAAQLGQQPGQPAPAPGCALQRPPHGPGPLTPFPDSAGALAEPRDAPPPGVGAGGRQRRASAVAAQSTIQGFIKLGHGSYRVGPPHRCGCRCRRSLPCAACSQRGRPAHGRDAQELRPGPARIQ